MQVATKLCKLLQMDSILPTLCLVNLKVIGIISVNHILYYKTKLPAYK